MPDWIVTTWEWIVWAFCAVMTVIGHVLVWFFGTFILIYLITGLWYATLCALAGMRIRDGFGKNLLTFIYISFAYPYVIWKARNDRTMLR
jgi:hypothetical protein